MDDVHMLCVHARSMRTPVHGAPGHTTPRSMLCAHTQQHIRQAALRRLCETAEQEVLACANRAALVAD